MKKFDELILVGQSIGTHGVFDKPEEFYVTVMCEVENVGMNETYAMKSNGLQAEKTFRLANEEEYTQVSPACKVVIYKGERYQIQRTACDGNGTFRIVTSSAVRDR